MSDAATTPPDLPAPREPRWIYWVVGAAVVVVAVIGLIVYNTQQNNEEAQQKAEELAQKFEAAGLPVPEDLDALVNTLGTDGGAVCDDPDAALRKAILYDLLTNGASFVGRRPVIFDRRFVRGELLILETYCPDELDAFRDTIDDLKVDDTIRD